MKYIFSLAILFFSCPLFGQIIPVIKSNTTRVKSENSEVRTKFASDYQQVLSFTRSSYWFNNEKIYSVYLFDGKIWKKVKWKLKLNNNKKVRKETVKKMSFIKKDFEELLNTFTRAGFWNFEQDSLNLHKKDNEDGTSTLWTRSDGVADIFEIIANGNHRITSSYEAKYFESKISVKQRKKFIECRNLFLELNK